MPPKEQPRRLRQNRWWIAGCVATAATLTVLLFLVSEASSGRTGLNREVYPDAGFTGIPVLADVTTDLTLGFLNDDPELPRRFFSVRWRGFWHVPEAGTITLRGAGDDRLDVWLDGELMIRRTPPADMHTATRNVTLDAGVHEILVEYQQHGGSSMMRLQWQPRGGWPRGLAGHRLFPERPSPVDIRRARQVAWLARIVAAMWFAILLVVLLLLTRAWPAVLARFGTGSVLDERWRTGLRIALALPVIAVVLRAGAARLPGWNPESLWYDDLVYAASIRSADIWDLITVPLHVGPGLLLIWRGLYAVFPDPEWSLQLLPFASAVAAVPVMALVVGRLTKDDSLAVLAAAVTALNPLLARYAVFVHQYAVEFLITALFLLAAAGLRQGAPEIDPPRFRRTALLGGLAAFFSVPSVFVSGPIVNLGAASVVRGWFMDGRRPDSTILASAAMYNATVLGAYFLLRQRSNVYLQDYWAAGFMPTDSTGAMLGFLANNGLRLVDASLPAWGSSPGTVSWMLPFVGLGLGWLLAREQTRLFGMVVVAFFAARLVASALWIYPLGASRVDIFAFPVAICLFAAGVHAATAAFPRTATVKLAAAAVAVAFALARPAGAAYLETDDVPLATIVSSVARPGDGLILSQAGIFLTAFYGTWPATVDAADDTSHGTAVTLVRDRTLHLPMNSSQERLVTGFLNASQPDRAWYVAYLTRGWEDDVVAAMTRLGYTVRNWHETTTGRLYLGLRRPQDDSVSPSARASVSDAPEPQD